MLRIGAKGNGSFKAAGGLRVAHQDHSPGRGPCLLLPDHDVNIDPQRCNHSWILLSSLIRFCLVHEPSPWPRDCPLHLYQDAALWGGRS